MPTPLPPSGSDTPAAMLDPSLSMDKGVTAADPAQAKEADDVRKWRGKVYAARAYDADARRQYVRNRRYARGDSGFKVDANIVGTNIDILEAFLYARNPDVDVLPARAVTAPSIEAMRDAARMAAENDPSVVAMADQAAKQASWLALAAGQDPGAVAIQARQQAMAAAIDAKAQENLARIEEAYRRRTSENKAYSETVELTIARMWKDGRLKHRGRPWVRSALTVGVGWLKASWQERTAPSPETQQAINDLVANIAHLRQLRAELEDEQAGADYECKVAELERQLEAVQSKAEQVIAKGYVIDLVTAENMQVAPGFRIADYVDGPWMAERIPMEWEEGKAQFKLTKEQCARVTKYTARKPELQRQDESPNAADRQEVNPDQATEFVQGEPGNAPDSPDAADANRGAGCFMMVWEIWDRTSNHVLTFVEGLDSWVKPAWTPPPTTRFYPYFGLCTSEVDGQRHPQSPVERSSKLVDEYNRIGSAEAEHRRRIIPKTAFNAGAMAEEEASKLSRATTQEMVPIKLTSPQTDMRTVLFPVTYAALDPALYDRQRIMVEIERIWGVQEALSGAVQVAKTATEAEIQQSGFQARTGSRRDSIESILSELAEYTAELARYYLKDEDVREIAGPNAFWPPYTGPDDLRKMVTIDIRAGTTGKPNTSAEREAWGVLLPILKEGLAQYGQLVNAQPADMAKSLAALLRLTAERAGDRLDIDALLPPAGPAPMLAAPGMPGQAAMPGLPGEAPVPAVAAPVPASPAAPA